MALLVEQSPLFGAGIAVPTIAKPLDPFGLVTLGDLPGPLLRISHHPGYFAHRIPKRDAPYHKQVGAQHRISSLPVQSFQPRGFRAPRIYLLVHVWKYTTGFGITPARPREPVLRGTSRTY